MTRGTCALLHFGLCRLDWAQKDHEEQRIPVDTRVGDEFDVDLPFCGPALPLTIFSGEDTLGC
jgi:hypothetical protein